MVAILVALLSSAFILLTFHHQSVELGFELDRRLRNNANSAIQLVLADPTAVHSSAVDFFGEGLDSVYITQEPWGLFSKVSCKAVHGERTKKKTHLLGGRIQQPRLALYLSNSNKALGLVGNTQLAGDVQLPEKGAERAYAENKSYTGATLFSGAKRTAASQIPVLSNLQQRQMEAYFNGSFAFDQKIDWTDTEDRVFHPDSTYLLLSNEAIVLSESYQGNLIIQSTRKVMISSSAKLEGVIVLAPHIEILQGFQGALQAFGSDSIRVESNTNLLYPTVLAVDGRMTFAKIVVEDRVEMNACLLAHQPQFRLKENSLISVGRDIKMKGQIHGGGYVELKGGTIKGQVYANKLMLKTRSSVYENLLMDVAILPSQLDSCFAGLLFDDNPKGQLVQ